MMTAVMSAALDDECSDDEMQLSKCHNAAVPRLAGLPVSPAFCRLLLHRHGHSARPSRRRRARRSRGRGRVAVAAADHS